VSLDDLVGGNTGDPLESIDVLGKALLQLAFVGKKLDERVR
jgi:hypothetical protein